MTVRETQHVRSVQFDVYNHTVTAPYPKRRSTRSRETATETRHCEPVQSDGGRATADGEADLAIQLVDMAPSDRMTLDTEMDNVCRTDPESHRKGEQPGPCKTVLAGYGRRGKGTACRHPTFHTLHDTSRPPPTPPSQDRTSPA